MMNSPLPPIRMCKDWPPPEDVSELPAAAFLLSTLWQPGQTITIDFIDASPPPWKKAWVEKVVTEMVAPYVNLNLQFGNYGNSADIRITFAHENQAYSRLGTQSTWYKGSSEQPESMNLGWLDEPHSGSFQWKGVTYTFPGCVWCSSNQNGSVIIHEFGHALDMVHEHQNPEGGIQWNVPAVLSYFRGAPNYWNDDQIYFNVIDKYASSLLNASEFDPQSIMLYAFPSSLTTNGVGTQANAIMSPTDIEWMRRVYGDPPSGTTTTTTTTTPPSPSPTTSEQLDDEQQLDIEDEDVVVVVTSEDLQIKRVKIGLGIVSGISLCVMITLILIIYVKK